MSLDIDCRHMPHEGRARLWRSYVRFVGIMGLAVVVHAGCGSRHKTDIVETSAEAVAPAEVAKGAPAEAGAKPKGRAQLKDRPLGLIYRQAQDQARQRLTAENAHLRLDELDAQIEHEKEIAR